MGNGRMAVLLLSAAHISSATRAPMTGVPVVSPTPATMDRAKMVFIIWLARPQQCGAARLNRGSTAGVGWAIVH